MWCCQLKEAGGEWPPPVRLLLSQATQSRPFLFLLQNEDRTGPETGLSESTYVAWYAWGRKNAYSVYYVYAVDVSRLQPRNLWRRERGHRRFGWLSHLCYALPKKNARGESPSRQLQARRREKEG